LKNLNLKEFNQTSIRVTITCWTIILKEMVLVFL